MLSPSKQTALAQAADTLAEWLEIPAAAVHVEDDTAGSDDAVVALGPATFAMSWVPSGTVAAVARTIDRLRSRTTPADMTAVPLIVVPFMGEAGTRLCRGAGVDWLDLSGNARVIRPGLRLVVEGRPNRFVRRGRPANMFAPKSSRIARWLLQHPGEPVTQRHLARAVDLDEGLASRVVSRLLADGLLARDDHGTLHVPNPDLLLDAWAEAYDFERHDILRGHVAARSGETLVHDLARGLREAGLEFAATGLAAAWLATHFAGFRTTSIYLAAAPSAAVLDSLGFRDDPRGANVWLVVPRDEGVFHGATDYDGLRCVHPVQTWLDLRAHPERAAEAADHLRRQLLTWGRDA